MLWQLDATAVAGWPRRTVHFGASVVTVCRGMRQSAVAALFASGFLCIRAFVPATGGACLPLCMHESQAWILGV